MDYWLLVLAQVVALFAFLYYYFDRRNDYWSSRGVKGPAPWPLLGNFVEFVTAGQTKLEPDYFRKYGKVYGSYIFLDPVLTIVDHELIKQVMIKDFHVFVNRDKQPIYHEIWGTNLFSSEDEQWKRIRAITSPSFTTGKLRGMHALMNKSVDQLAGYFDRAIANNQGAMNIKEVIMGFTIDVIASTSFATETNSNGDRKAENVFLKYGQKLFDFKIWRFALIFLAPNKVNKFLNNETGFDHESFMFFVNISREIMKQRKLEEASGKKGVQKRNDLVQLMMDAFVYDKDLQDTNYEQLTATADNEDENEESEKTVQNGSTKRSLSENEIIAQCILFFAAGFETTATTISNALYLLALNPEAQDRLYEELSQALEGVEYNSEQYYDVVMNQIPYLEGTIKETLRMNPPVTRLQRRVGVDNYKLGGIPLTKDVEVNISAYAVHYNPEYYPEPEKFNPERFLPENKHLLVPYTYLPFGAGPRNCIGMRFAYQEMKLCLAQIIRSYQFAPTPETKIPLDFNKIGILSAKDIQLRVSKRV